MRLLRALALAPAIAAALAAGCTRTVHVKVEGPHSDVKVGDVALGAVPAEGAGVDVPAGIAAVPYEVRRGDVVTVGELQRTEPNPWLLGGALGGVACCLPSALALGFCVANPGALLAPYFVVTGYGDFGSVNAACVAPSWATLPVLSGCGALGISPAVLALWADAPPSEVSLPAPGAPDATAAPDAPDAPEGPLVPDGTSTEKPEGVPW